MSIRGERFQIARFAARLKAGGHALDVRHVAPAHEAARLLTAPQEAAIREALRQGYYDIPRPINLQDLAAKLGISSASLSERLRRAEGRIIRQFAADADADDQAADAAHAAGAAARLVSEAFLTGFLQDEKADPPMWGRPADVMVMRDGSMLVSDDHNGIIYRVSYAKK